jgi:hypothetical protein
MNLSECEQAAPNYPRLVVRIVLAAVVAFHLLVPLRHHYFEGDVAWTEQGHRYAWRMMLRSKRGYGYFNVKNVHTGEVTKVDPADYLTDRQCEKLFTHPDMILQFAHHLRNLWKRRGVEEVEVYASARASLNGRPARTYVDSSIDLAKEQWHFFKKSDWVLGNDSNEE